MGHPSSLQVYPNPASDAALVVSPTSGVLRVMDLQGRELFQVQVEANIPLEVDLTGLAQGLYVVRVGEAIQRIQILR
jgi:hypothetical protein